MTTSSTDALQDRIEGEKRVARRLIRRLKNEGYSLRIWSDETGEYETEHGATESELLEAFASLDITRLDVFRDTQRIGWFLLVRGNSPEELISNYSQFEGAEEIWQEVVAAEEK